MEFQQLPLHPDIILLFYGTIDLDFACFSLTHAQIFSFLWVLQRFSRMFFLGNSSKKKEFYCEGISFYESSHLDFHVKLFICLKTYFDDVFYLFLHRTLSTWKLPLYFGTCRPNNPSSLRWLFAVALVSWFSDSLNPFLSVPHSIFPKKFHFSDSHLNFRLLCGEKRK